MKIYIYIIIAVLILTIGIYQFLKINTESNKFIKEEADIVKVNEPIKKEINKVKEKNIQKKVNSVKNEKLFNNFSVLYLDIKDKYKENQNFNNCMINSTNSCINQTSFQNTGKPNIELCDDFISDDRKQSCKDNIISLIAVNENSIEKCSELKNEQKQSCKEQVILKIAMEKGDVNLCNNLEIKKIKNDSKIGKNNIKIPELLNNNNIVDNCKNRIYTNLAQKNKKESYCLKISNSFEKDMCIQRLKMEKEISIQRLKMEKQLNNIRPK